MSEAFLQMAGVFSQLELAMIRARVRSGMENARTKGRQIGRPQITVNDLPSGFLRHYPAYKIGYRKISELSRVCDLIRRDIKIYVLCNSSQMIMVICYSCIRDATRCLRDEKDS